jgi:hypothetical protein
MHHDKLRPERVQVHVLESPATQPEQRRDNRERRHRGERLAARHADQQPGAEHRSAEVTELTMLEGDTSGEA